MRKIMISIRPEWVAKILNGEKTIEIRKSMPKCELPCEVYIYCTKDKYLHLFKDRHSGQFYSSIHWEYPGIDIKDYAFNGLVVAKFTMYRCEKYQPLNPIDNAQYEFAIIRWHSGVYKTYSSCLTTKEIVSYAKDKPFYGWFIDNLEVFEEAKDLAEFGIERAPQSWCYIKEDNSCSHLE